MNTAPPSTPRHRPRARRGRPRRCCAASMPAACSSRSIRRRAPACWPRRPRCSASSTTTRWSTASTPASASWRSTRIGNDHLAELQRNLVLSHSVGTGEPLARRRGAAGARDQGREPGARPFGRAARAGRCAAGAVQRRRAAAHSVQGLGRRLGRPRAAGAPGLRADRRRRGDHGADGERDRRRRGHAPHRPRALRARPQGRPGAAQRHAGLDRAGAGRPVRRRERVRGRR